MDNLLDLKTDIVFQELFGKQKNKEATSHLLSLILGREVRDIDLDVNKRMLGDRKDAKTGRLDVRAKFNDGEDCDIELQVETYKYMTRRMLSYWACMYQNKISSGQKYGVLKPSISILITNYKLKETQDIDNYHTVWNLRDKEYPDIIIDNNIELHILEIPKIKEDDIFKDELALWLKFIENPKNEEVQKSMCENVFLKQAMEELAYLSGDPDFKQLVQSRADFLRDQYNFREDAKERGLEEGRAQGREEGREEGRAEGRAEGLAEGKQHEKVEMAKKLLKINMTEEEVAEITELELEEIKRLK